MISISNAVNTVASNMYGSGVKDIVYNFITEAQSQGATVENVACYQVFVDSLYKDISVDVLRAYNDRAEADGGSSENTCTITFIRSIL